MPRRSSFSPSLEDQEAVFSALAHAVRRQIVVLLSRSGGELPSGYLASRFAHSWPTTTRHLRVLEDAGILEVRREGRGSHYRLVRERLTSVVEGWLAHLAPPTPDETWTSDGPRTVHALEAPHTKKKGTTEP